MNKNHLGNAEELELFLSSMKLELEKHAKEKTPLRNKTLRETLLHSLPEIENRLDILKDTADLLIMKKQSVHIANYCLMIYLKSKEVLEK